jgi:hypothetical protein
MFRSYLELREQMDSGQRLGFSQASAVHRCRDTGNLVTGMNMILKAIDLHQHRKGRFA